MPIFITDKATDLPSLAASLARSARTTDATLERIKVLNPHLAAGQKLAAGTVLILPDSADLKPGVGEPAGAHSLSELATRLRAGLRDADTRMSQRAAQLATEQSAVREALKAAAAKRLVESDPVLKKQLAAADAAFKAEQKQLASVQAKNAENAKLIEAQFAKLQKLLG